MDDKSVTLESRPWLLDFSRSSSQLLTVQTIRMAFLAIVLSITVMYQVLNATFVSFDIFFSVYVLLTVSFFLNCCYILFLEKFLHHWFVTAGLFVWETFYVSCLIYFIGISQSLLVFLYLINIILCGVVFQRKGGIYLALVTSVAFSFLLAIDRKAQGNTLYLAVGINNLAFFTVAYLSGYLSEQLNFMGVELRERGRDIKLLKNLNSMIVNNMEAGLLTVDIRGEILQQNSKALQLLNKDKNIVGQSLALVSRSLYSVLNEGVTNSPREIFMDGANGTEPRILRANIFALNDEYNIRKGSIVFFEDVTNFKKLESRLQQSEKLAAIGQLAAGIAHEIRNPLASISGSVQLLQAENPSPDQVKLMSIVIKEIDRLNKLITEFLDYARPQAPNKDTVNISDLLREVTEAVKLDKQSQGLSFDLQITPGLMIQGQADKLKQALWNIVINGVQAMDSCLIRQLTIKADAKNNECVIKIQDTGQGIPPLNLKKIFEPFHTTKPKGTGLGLAIVHSILEAHGATVEVKSQIDQGTEFTITFRKVLSN